MNEVLAASMSSLAALCGGSMGWAILALALLARLALLPLTLHLSRRMLANQRRMRALQPQADAIRQRLENDPQAAFAAVSDLYKQNGVKLFDLSSLLGALLQWPLFGLLYRTIRQASTGHKAFLWMKSLALPDAGLTLVVLALTAVAAYYFPSLSAAPSMLMVALQVAIVAFMVWKLAAGLGLYWAASSAVGVVQAFVLRRESRRSISCDGSAAH